MPIKTPVLLIFFNRPKIFKKMFEEIRKAKPKVLFLAQDGARKGVDSDKEDIILCQEIASEIDWECDVKKSYSEVNLGCGVRPASAISWAFQYTEELIILEDDCIPETSFFSFCEILLRKYKDDERIAYISGINHFEKWDYNQSSYFFSKTGAIAGWALWKRSWVQNDYYVEGINDPYVKNIIGYQFDKKSIANSRIKAWVDANNSKSSGLVLSHWDIQWGFVKYSQNQLVIVPKYNQICNIGVGIGSTHSQKMKDTKYIKGKNFVFIPTKELEFPLIHPKYMLCDKVYDKRVYKITQGSILMQIKQKIKNILK